MSLIRFQGIMFSNIFQRGFISILGKETVQLETPLGNVTVVRLDSQSTEGAEGNVVFELQASESEASLAKN